jgi:hypothetical protein
MKVSENGFTVYHSLKIKYKDMTTTTTHLISADLIQTNNNQLLVRFAHPNELMDKKPYSFASSDFDVERRRIFLTRNYIVEKLTSWLRQREYAAPGYKKEAESLLTWLVCYKETSYTNVVSFVNRHHNAFTSMAPSERSRFYDHYKTIVEPILIYCKENQSA